MKKSCSKISVLVLLLSVTSFTADQRAAFSSGVDKVCDIVMNALNRHKRLKSLLTDKGLLRTNTVGSGFLTTIGVDTVETAAHVPSINQGAFHGALDLLSDGVVGGWNTVGNRLNLRKIALRIASDPKAQSATVREQVMAHMQTLSSLDDRLLLIAHLFEPTPSSTRSVVAAIPLSAGLLGLIAGGTSAAGAKDLVTPEALVPDSSDKKIVTPKAPETLSDAVADALK